MRTLLLLPFIFLQLLESNAQPNPFAKERIGDTITINGRIYAGNFLKNVISKPTFLNVYDSNPSRMLMLRIDSGDRKNFNMPPEQLYLNKRVSITGVLDDYKGIALIKIKDNTDVFVDESDPGPQPVTSTGSYMSGQAFGYGKSDSAFRKRQDSVKAILSADTARNKKQLPIKVFTSETIKPIAHPVADTIISDNRVVLDTVQHASEKIMEPAPAEEPVMPDNNSPQNVKTIRLKNLPVARTAPSYNSVDTSSKANWLRTISSQPFEPVVNDTLIVSGSEIDMHTGPTTDAPVVAYLMKRMTVLVTYKSKKWSYVTVQNPDGTTGLSGFIKNKAYKHLDVKAAQQQ